MAIMNVFQFGTHTLDLQRCTLQRGDDLVALRPKAFDVLRQLVENAGRVVGKDELMRAVWPGVVVTDDALVQCIGDVRRALGGDADAFIRTVPRRGYLFCVEPTPPATAAPPRVEQDVRYCRTADGVRLALATTGQGLPLVRPPTWFNHLEYDWHVQFRSALYHFLAERCELVRYDGRGNGLSERHVPEISFETFGLDLQAVVDALGLQRYALLGISQGAPIAIAHAVQHPDRVRKLVLNGGMALGSNKRGSTRDHETAQAYLTLMRHGWGDEHSAFLRAFGMLYFPSASLDELKGLAQLQRMAMTADVALRLRMATADIDVTELLPRVSVPTLVLHSRHDNAVPFEEGQRLAAAIPHARFVALESENHVPMPDEPAWPAFVGAIESFLSE